MLFRANPRSSISCFNPPRVSLLIAITFFGAAVAWGQQGTTAVEATTPTNSTPADKQSPENSSDQSVTFTKRVNLVVVPVVIRDKHGKAVGSLTREDFRVFDDGKPQTISTFNVEANPQPGEKPAQSPTPGPVPIDKVVGVAPTHFYAYLFDDVHLAAGDLMQVRAAAKKHLDAGMGPEDRAAVFTTSGDRMLGFTNNKAEVTQAIDHLKPGFAVGGGHCPYMDYYLAKKIVEEFDGGSSITPAWDATTDDTWNCLFNRETNLEPKAREMALEAARREVMAGDANTQRALVAIETAVRRLSAMPGARTLILVSPGFLTSDEHVEQISAISLATERNIVINALDARGLYTGIAGADTGNGASTLNARQMEEPLERIGRSLQTGVMEDLTDGTGGKFFHDSNDLAGGFDQLATPPEFVYVLAFKPENLKEGGRYHHLKVVMASKHDWTVQARRGYYELANAGDPERLLADELQATLLSRDEMRTMPITLETGYSKKDGAARELSVTTHLDVSGIHFHRVNDRNVDDLTIVCGLFDLNGNYLQGKKQEISLHLEDSVLKRLADGVNIQTKFDVQPGAYLIRVVVRDSGDQLLSAVNGSGLVQ